jgi:hypothetical protein
MNARIRDNAGRIAAGLVFAATLGTALAASPPDSEIRGRSADTTVPHHAAPLPGSGATTASSSADDSGDPDSFGRSLQWLGLADGNVDLAADCTGDTFPCAVLAPAPAVSSFSLSDLGHISLPAKAAHSLICYWFSPVLTVGYGNDSAAPVVAELDYDPTVTIENPVLDDPSLIDPNTGAPFDGKLVTAMTSIQNFQVPLQPGAHITERTRDSAVCIAGLISRNTLVETFGLTDPQAREFFKRPMTLRLNVDGTARFLDFATLYFGWRLVGD